MLFHLLGQAKVRILKITYRTENQLIIWEKNNLNQICYVITEKGPHDNSYKYVTAIGNNILWHGKNQVVFSSAFPTRQCCCIFRNKLARAHCWTGQGCLWRVSHSSAWRCLNVRLTGPWNGWPPISTICLQCTTMMARGRRVKCVS